MQDDPAATYADIIKELEEKEVKEQEREIDYYDQLIEEELGNINKKET